ncbi:MAG TPA: hypothetical protein VJT74_12685, partial [Pyrinomonadaceae bacterium]|nr:hypothetical protein [Pyrinomonadaceae bacterium]
YLIMGTDENLRRCLEARAAGRALTVTANYLHTFPTSSGAGPPNVLTYTADAAPARTFITSLATQRGVRERPTNDAQLEEALGRLRYAVSETRLADRGFERRTLSSFGQFGTLASQFAPADDATAEAR